MSDDGFTRRVDTRGAQLVATVCGSGSPALVLLHYFGGSRGEWDEVVQRLHARPDGERAFRTIAVDLRGHGDSSGSDSGYRVADGAYDIEALVRALRLNIDGYVLIGHSMSGKHAMLFASRRPEGLRALILVAPSPPTPEPIPDATRAALLAQHGDPHAAASTVDGNCVARLPDAVRSRAITDNLRTSPIAWRAWLEQGSREDITEDVTKIETPTLVLVGEADHTIPPSLVEREVLPRIRGATLQRVPGAAHFAPMETPDAIAASICAFVRRVVP